MTAVTSSNGSVQRSRRATLLNYFSLFSSFSTLLCCAFAFGVGPPGDGGGCGLALISSALASQPVAS